MKEKSKPKPPAPEPTPEPTPEPAGDKEGKKQSNQGYAYNVHVIRVSLDNSRKPGSFADHIAKYGTAHLDEGSALLGNLDALRVKQLNAIAEKSQSYRIITDLKKIAKASNRGIRVLGKEAFRDNLELLDKLGLSGKIPQKYTDWEAHTLRLHNNLTLPGVMETFAKYNVSAEALTAAKDAITAVHNAITERNRLKAEAEKATQLKNDAYKLLMEWWKEFKKIVNIALKNDPQLKEQIYVVAPS
ncbi:MAG: hypothetical protein GY940_04395 [bacterium]|nr:hypothetical protein [bacterium]